MITKSNLLRYLTDRHKKLTHRKNRAEELLALKQQLEEQEAEVAVLEKQALANSDKTGKGWLAELRRRCNFLLV